MLCFTTFTCKDGLTPTPAGMDEALVSTVQDFVLPQHNKTASTEEAKGQAGLCRFCGTAKWSHHPSELGAKGPMAGNHKVERSA